MSPSKSDSRIVSLSGTSPAHCLGYRHFRALFVVQNLSFCICLINQYLLVVNSERTFLKKYLIWELEAVLGLQHTSKSWSPAC